MQYLRNELTHVQTVVLFRQSITTSLLQIISTYLHTPFTVKAKLTIRLFRQINALCSI